MKIENFTNRLQARQSRPGLLSFLSALVLVLAVGTVSAQCPLNCNNNVQVSLDADCEVTITPAMILEGEGPSTCPYQVILKSPSGVPMAQPVVTSAHIGMTLEVEVRRTDNNNRCWGTITVEDKLPPSIVCVADTIFVECYANAVVPNPVVVENCDDFTLETLSDVTVDMGCDQPYSAIRTVQFRATDASGNQSDVCSRIVAFRRIGNNNITFPLNFDDTPGNNASLNCGTISTPFPSWDNGAGVDDNGVPFANNGYPDVVETGAPMTADGNPIFPNNSLCELNATFDDQVLTICEASFKVLRRWSVLDWCTGELEERYQIIKVVDNQGPLATAPQDNFMVPSDPYSCTGDYTVQDPIVSFECGTWTYTVGYLLADATGGAPINGLYIDDNVMTVGPQRYVIRDLPVGQTWIRYTLTDGCGNTSFAFTEVIVMDDVPPVPVCDQNTVVTLTSDGVARIKALTFDDLSHDNCTPVQFDARRMTNGCGAGTGFGEFVEFCCTDVGQEIMVELRVWDDANGNGIYGDEISVFFDQNGSGVLGDIVNGEEDLELRVSDNFNTCMVNVTVQDKIDPVIVCPDNITLECGQDPFDMSITGQAVGVDNCGTANITNTPSGSLDQCGVGTITRRFVITDGGGRFDDCTQRITVVNNNPFDFNDPNDLRWPRDRDLTGCQRSDIDPSQTGEPIIGDDACSLVATTFNDQTFEFVDSACFKIIRTWTVIDWCQFDQNGSGRGMDQYVQIIKLNNSNEPDFVSCPTTTQEFCIIGDDCIGEVELTISAEDDCTPASDLVYSYAIDADNNGSIDIRGSGNDATRDLPTGTHSITWTVEDMCGNTNTCSYNFIVKDCKKPTPYCRSQINTVVMPSTNQISIWAIDYDLGSTDNCDGPLQFSFSSNTSQTSLTFDCTQLGINDIELWVTDQAGNQDFCSVRIDIQSNGDCNGSTPAGIGGRVANEGDQEVAEVMVALEAMSNSEMKYYVTATDGRFAFADLADSQYKISAERDDYHGNGVSTLDLVLIQRHIIGLSPLNTPYKVIAADINKSESVTGADVVELRRLILGITDEYTNNTSWRFIDADHQHFDPASPWPVRDFINVTNSSQPQLEEDMVAVKIGDVNASHRVNITSRDQDLDSRGAADVTLAIDDNAYTAGDLVSVPFYATSTGMSYGYQFTLEYDASTMTYVDASGLSSEHIHQVEPGVLSIAFDAAQGINVSESDELFAINFEADNNVRLSNALSVTSTVTKAELYDDAFNVKSLGLEVRGSASEITLMQNSPNPFSDETYISFSLPEAMTATISVFDVTGKVVKQYNDTYNAGVNTVTVTADELGVQGLLYYQLQAEGFKATKKMILINN